MNFPNINHSSQHSPDFSPKDGEKPPKKGSHTHENAAKILDNPIPESSGQGLEKKVIKQEGESWFFRLMPDVFLRAAIKAGETLLVNSTELSKRREASAKKLESLTGSSEFSLFLGALSPLIVSAIQKNAAKDNARIFDLIGGENKFLTDSVDAILHQMTVNLMNHIDEPPISIASILSFLIKTVSKQVDANQLAIIAAEKDPTKQREALNQLLKPLIEELLAITFPNGAKDLPLNSPISGYVWDYLKESLLPKAFSALFLAFMNAHSSSAMEKLKGLENGNFLAQIVDELGNKFPKLTAQAVEKNSNTIASAIAKQLPNAEQLPEAMQESLNDSWNSERIGLQSWLEQEIIKLGKSQDPHIQSLLKFIGTESKPLLAHILFNLAKDSPGKNAIDAIFSNLMITFGSFIEENSKEIQVLHEQLEAQGLNPVKEKAFVALFQPLATKMMEMTGLHYSQDNPLLHVLGKNTLVVLENTFLPELFAKMYLDTSTWQIKKDHYRREIRGITQTNYIPESCHLLAEWIHNTLSTKMAIKRNELAQMIYTFAKRFVDEAEIDSFLQEHQEEIQSLLSQEIINVAKEMIRGGPAVTAAKSYLETILLKAFSNLTSHIHSLESPKGAHYQEEFLSKAALRLLTVFNEHVCKINEIKRQHGKATADAIDPEKMTQDFGVLLHPAFPKEFKEERKTIRQAQKLIDAERKKISKTKNRAIIESSREKIREAQKDLKEAKTTINEYRLEHYFVPLANDLATILNLDDPEKFPMPKNLADPLLQKVIPLLLMEVFDELATPTRKNQLLLVALESFEAALEKKKEQPIQQMVYEDETQRDLDRACGEMVLHILQMIPIRLLPEALVKVLFNLTNVQNVSGEKIGSALRAKLKEDWSLIKIVDKGLAEGIANLYKGKWDSFQGEEHYTLRTKTVDEQGNIVEDVSAWESSLPLNVEDQEIRDQLKWEKEQNRERVIRKKLGEVPRKALVFSLKDFMTKPWNKFHKSLNRLIREHLGLRSLIAKQFCDYICHQIFFTFLGGILAVVSYPLRTAFSYLIEVYLRLKLRHLYEMMQSDIHDNLYYYLGEELIDMLKIDAPKASKDWISELMGEINRPSAFQSMS